MVEVVNTPITSVVNEAPAERWGSFVFSVGGCEEDRSHPVHLSAVALRHTHQRW